MTYLLELFIADNIKTIEFYDTETDETLAFENKDDAMEFAEKLEQVDEKELQSFEFDSDRNAFIINF